MALAILGASSVHNAYAESTINCHCFKNRDFNPADTFAADDYILATSFNSLVAKSFAISKGQIVMFKMKEGVGQDDLLIGLKASKVSGADLQNILALRRAGKKWPEILLGLGNQEKITADKLLAEMKNGMPADEAGAKIADELIMDFYSVPAEKIVSLRKSGLNEKELALVFILAHFSEKKPEALFALHSKNGISWSEIAHNLGVEPAAAGKLILAYPAKQINQ